MYLPRHFASDDLGVLDALVARDAFATLVTVTDGEPFASHLPVSYRRDGRAVRFQGHWARANPQWSGAAGADALLIVHGPHAHVSPSWYEQPAGNVPTWNYVVAHVRGALAVVDDPLALEHIVTRLADPYEAKSQSSWRFDDVLPETRDQLRGIVGFELVARRIDIKRKLSQHHALANLDGAVAGLKQRAHGDDGEIATLMAEVADAKRAAVVDPAG